MGWAKLYIYELMNDKRTDFFSEFIKIFLWFASLVYRLLIFINNMFYKFRVFKSYKVPVKVISVGNITLGGTGKTPFAIMVAKKLSKTGKNVAILIRGYGEDEWRMAEAILERYNVKVLVGRDRVELARKAYSLGVEVVVLDDGFQHRRLKRNLDIVLVDSTNPFGNRSLFPRGILREPITGLVRADMIVFTKSDKASDIVRFIENDIRKIFPYIDILWARYRVTGLINIKTGDVFSNSKLWNRKICTLSSVCSPEYFRYLLLQKGAKIKIEFIYPDHHMYKKRDMKRIFIQCKEKDIKEIVTTQKDGVKLRMLNYFDDTIDILELAIELEVVKGEKILNDRLYSLFPRKSN